MKVGIAGITGVTTTYFLTQKGFKVDLIESRRYSAMATSYANGGQLSASNLKPGIVGVIPLWNKVYFLLILL